MRHLTIFLTVISVLCFNVAHSAETFATHSLSYESAAKAIQGSLQEAKKLDRNVAIVIIDADGDVIAAARMDGAKPSAYALALQKAKTALIFRGSSRTAMEEINGGSTALLSLDNLAALPGGLAIKSESEFIAAVGVPGAPADIDEAIAAAGLNRIAD